MLPPGEHIIETKKCLLSGKEFFVTDRDFDMYEKLSPIFGGKKYLIATPMLCPEERLRRKMCFRNERTLYKGSCDATKKEIVSIYPPEKKFTVYDHTLWWRDSWSGLDHGRIFDFEKSFFRQFHELQMVVPRPSLFGKNNENCPYTNHCDGARDCHICTSVGRAERIYYSDWIVGSSDSCDCYHLNSSEKTYQSLFGENLYNCAFTLYAKNCRDSKFLYDCQGCKDCFLCVNLRNREYCIKNVQYSPEEYFRKVSEIPLSTAENVTAVMTLFLSFVRMQPHVCHHILQSEQAIGDFISHSKNIIDCHMIWDSENLRHCFLNMELKDSIDTYESGFHCDAQIEAHACNHSKRIGFSNISYEDTDVWYSDLCHNAQDCFGCIGLHAHEHHCILNKSYSTQEYEHLAGKIINHMRSTGEWGEFFPHEISPFGYNETVAQEYFPMTEEKIKNMPQFHQWRQEGSVLVSSKSSSETRGWNWHSEEKKITPAITYQPLPIDQYNEKIVGNKVAQKHIDEALNGIIHCVVSGKPFRIIKQELAFYIEHSHPIPTKHPDERHKERMNLRNPRKLYERHCMCEDCEKIARETNTFKDGEFITHILNEDKKNAHKKGDLRRKIITTYSPDRPERIFCEECYEKILY